MDLGALFLILALAMLVGMFISRPFFAVEDERALAEGEQAPSNDRSRDHTHSTLLAERDRLLSALQELDFDYGLGKIPAEDYPPQRAALAQRAAEVLRNLDESFPSELSEEAPQPPVPPAPVVIEPPDEELEVKIASYRRSRQEKAIGFCPRCGKPVKKTDKFCSRCGMPIAQ